MLNMLFVALDATLQMTELIRENDALRNRNHIVFIASMLLMALIMMIFVWNVRSNSRRHLLALERKNHALQIEHDKAVRARQEAEEASQMKTRFIQQITHEIRTPLNAINGFTTLLCEPGIEFEAQERAEMGGMITENTLALTSMLDSVIHLADFDSSRLMVYPKSMSISEFLGKLKGVSLISTHVVQASGNEIVAKGTETFTTDGNLLAQALQSVIDNALKFGQKAKLDLKLREGEMQISVTDEGPGVPAEYAERIFERFFKVDSFVPGMGIGLCVSRCMLEKLSGSICLDTTYKGEGARFVINCPVG